MCVCGFDPGRQPQQASTEVAAGNEFLPFSRSCAPPPSQFFRGAVKGKPWGWPGAAVPGVNLARVAWLPPVAHCTPPPPLCWHTLLPHSATCSLRSAPGAHKPPVLLPTHAAAPSLRLHRCTNGWGREWGSSCASCPRPCRDILWPCSAPWQPSTAASGPLHTPAVSSQGFEGVQAGPGGSCLTRTAVSRKLQGTPLFLSANLLASPFCSSRRTRARGHSLVLS